MVTLVGDQPIEALRRMLDRVHNRFLGMPEVQEDESFVPGHPIFERTKAAIGHSLEHIQALERM